MATEAHQRPRPPFIKDADHIIIGRYSDADGEHIVGLTRGVEGPWHLIDVACVDRYAPGETLNEARPFADAYLRDRGGAS